MTFQCIFLVVIPASLINMVDNSVSFEKSTGIWCCVFRSIPRTATLCFFCSDKVSKLVLTVAAIEALQKYLTSSFAQV